MTQPGIGFNDAYVAGKITNVNSPIYGAQGWHKYMANGLYLPQGYYSIGGSFTTTVNRCYYFPFAVNRPYTFAGAVTGNQGTGDNGEKLRMMVFRDDAAAGGPGTLEKDFGEITLTGAAATRTLTSSWAAVPGLYWGAIWHETAAAMHGMAPHYSDTAAGTFNAMNPVHIIPNLTWAVGVSTNSLAHALYVDTAYGVAPSSAVTPTATIVISAGTTVGVPIFWLKG